MREILTHPATLYTITEWVIRVGALIVVPMRRNPAAARAWLLAILFLPIPGLLLFWLIGRPRFPAWRAERFRAQAPMLADIARGGSPTRLRRRRSPTIACRCSSRGSAAFPRSAATRSI